MFLNTLKDACSVAEKDDNLVTIGITPDYPEVSYGYIKFISASTGYEKAYQVDRFVEKPGLEVAKEYLKSEEYLWNSGMFVWKTSSILLNMKKIMPEVYDGLIRIQAAIGTADENIVLEKEFQDFVSQSVDYGIMEKADHIYTLPGTFGWDDVGSWLAVERIKKSNELGNVIDGNIITVDTHNCIIQGGKKLLAVVGLENVVIVDTEDATLICAKDSTAGIKKVIENLNKCNRNEYI